MMREESELSDYIEGFADKIAKNGKWKQDGFYIGKYIPDKKQKNAMASYAHLIDTEKPLLLIDDTLFGSAKEGLCLTNVNLYYNAILKPGKTIERGAGSIPLIEIESVSFDFAEFDLNGTKASGTILYINSRPFTYLLKTYDNAVLNDLFSNLNKAEHLDIARLQKPVWAFDDEELIRDMSRHKINENYSMVITNARIVNMYRHHTVVQSGGYLSPEMFFNWIELSDVRDVLPVQKGYDGKLVLEFINGNTITYIAMPDVIKELRMYLWAALKRKIPVIKFEDSDEKILFKEQVLSHDGVFCSDAFWEEIFGDKRIDARFCVTNKRFLYYRVNQISGISKDGSYLNYSFTPPSYSCIWLPLSGLTGLTKEKKTLFNTMRLSITNCAPVGQISESAVVPGIDCQNGALCYDPEFADVIRGSAVLDFDHMFSLSKKERREVSEILRSLFPDIEMPEI